MIEREPDDECGAGAIGACEANGPSKDGDYPSCCPTARAEGSGRACVRFPVASSCMEDDDTVTNAPKCRVYARTARQLPGSRRSRWRGVRRLPITCSTPAAPPSNRVDQRAFASQARLALFTGLCRGTGNRLQRLHRAQLRRRTATRWLSSTTCAAPAIDGPTIDRPNIDRPTIDRALPPVLQPQTPPTIPDPEVEPGPPNLDNAGTSPDQKDTPDDATAPPDAAPTPPGIEPSPTDPTDPADSPDPAFPEVELRRQPTPCSRCSWSTNG